MGTKKTSRRMVFCAGAMLISLLVTLTAPSASAAGQFYSLYHFKNARASASIDYLDVESAGNGDAGGRIRLIVDGPGSYYVKYRAGERGPLKWHRGTRNVKKSQGLMGFQWSDEFLLRTWAYEFKICKHRKGLPDPCGDSMVIPACAPTCGGLTREEDPT